jgi:hypothetical protein
MTNRLEYSHEVSIVIPCFNESETLLFCIEEAQASLAAAKVSGEILIADNGSGDDSKEIAKNAGARVINVTAKGYGNALLGGIKAAKGRYILMGDADGSYDFRELPNFLRELRGGAQLVMGCRLPRGGGTVEPGAMPWMHRWLGNPVLSALGRLFFRTSVDDFHCGLRAFSKEAAMSLGLSCSGMEFASEMVVKAVRDKLVISQIPITLRPDRRSGPSHLRSWRDGWRHLRFMLMFAPGWLFLGPGVALLLFGVAGFASLLFSPLTIGDVTFDTNTLLICAMATLVGMQILSFAMLVKAFATREGFLTSDPRLEKFLKASPVEWGVAVGVALIVAGVAYLAVALAYWRESGFGPLPYEQSVRIVIPAVTGISLGVQTFFFGFVLGVIDLEKSATRLENQAADSTTQDPE